MFQSQSSAQPRTRFAFLALAAIALTLVSVACGGGHIGHLVRAKAASHSNTSSATSSNASGSSAGSGPSSPNPNSKTITGIQSMSDWQWCSKSLPNGGVCAAGRGNAQSSLLPHQITPSMDRDSSMFAISGPTPYSNALWWRPLDVPQNATHFTYDVYFYLDDPAAPEALEFDANQSFGNVRYTWGTECSYKNTGMWDIWDPQNEKWVTTSVPCKQVSANAWHHLVWQFEKVQGGVHYIGVELDGQFTSVDRHFGVQQNWPGVESDVAFQMDGNFQQKPYKVWLDRLNLTTW